MAAVNPFKQSNYIWQTEYHVLFLGADPFHLSVITELQSEYHQIKLRRRNETHVGLGETLAAASDRCDEQHITAAQRQVRCNKEAFVLQEQRNRPSTVRTSITHYL